MSADNFYLEIDCILYFATNISEVSILQEFGLHCSEQVVRRINQGTVSVVFFFENMYIELVWIEDREAAEHYRTTTGIDILTHTYWQQTKASPFGLGLRAKTEKTNLTPHSWKQASPSAKFSTENLAKIEEPICFFVPEQLTLTNWLNYSCVRHQQLISHPLGLKKLTNVRIAIDTDKKLTNTISLLEQNHVLSIEKNTYPLLELTFDNNCREKFIDARPILPICLKF